MIKARVLVPLNIRTGKPEILPDNNTGDKYYDAGDVVEIAEAVIGEKYKDSNVWYKLSDGGFVWSGGVDKNESTHIAFNSYKLFNPNLITWNKSIKQIPLNWQVTKGKGVKIAILDTGICNEHEDFTKAFSVYEDFTPVKDKIDYDGHGTHVAGIIGGRSQMANGLIGVAPECELIILKVQYDEKDGFHDNYQHYIDALKMARAKGADIINISLSIRLGNDDDVTKRLKIQELKDIIKELTDTGIAIVGAAGDKADLKTGKMFFPAECKEVISVAAINEDYFTRYPIVSKDLNLVGPFANYYSTYKEPKYYGSFSGCSMVTAFISGILALAISANRSNRDQRFSKSQLLGMLSNHSLALNQLKYSDNSSFSYHLLNS